MEGYSAGQFDHEGNFGYVIVGEPSLESLKARAKSLGYVVRDKFPLK
jgi:hypothetical protein